MKYVPTFNGFMNESFKKPYGEKISLDDFKKISIGSEVLYAGATYTVDKNDGFVLILSPTKGSNAKLPIKINFSMFNQAGAIRESINEELALSTIKSKYPNSKITFEPNTRFKDAYNVRVDIIRQDGGVEYLGGIRGPISKEEGLHFIENTLSRNYDKFY